MVKTNQLSIPSCAFLYIFQTLNNGLAEQWSGWTPFSKAFSSRAAVLTGYLDDSRKS